MSDTPSNKDGGGEEPKMAWMYAGPKSSINREDYLLGKRIDKNFEMFSDVVIQGRDEEQRADDLFRAVGRPKLDGEQSSASHSHRAGAVMPLPKQSVLDTSIVRTEDPLVALKVQEEKRRRALLDNPMVKARAQRILKEAFEKEMAHKREHGKRKRHGHDDSSSSTSRSHSSKRGTSKESRRHHHHHENEHNRYSESGKTKLSAPVPSAPSSSSHRHTVASATVDEGQKRRKPLTAEEVEARRAAMESNAKWRDEVREENILSAAEKLKAEEESARQNKAGASFLKPMIASADSSSSVEKRLQSNKKNLQRSHDYMEKPFARK